MPRLVALTLLASVLSTNALADDCLDRFKQLLTDRSDKGPVKIHVTQGIKGQAETKNWFYSLGPNHWMSEMIEPENLQWTLFYQDKMYSSSDKGGSWSFVRDMNTAEFEEATKKTLASDAETATNQQCSEEELDGVVHEKVYAEYQSGNLQGAKVAQTYWINSETGWLSKSHSHTMAAAFEMQATQVLEKAPGLELPKPE